MSHRDRRGRESVGRESDVRVVDWRNCLLRLEIMRPLPPPCPGLTARLPRAVEARAITKLYGSTVALWRADLSLRSGELVAVQGPNASGKSTLLRILAGLTPPTSGQITWMDAGGTGRPRIAHVGHESHLYIALSPLENLRLTAHLARRDLEAGLRACDRLGLTSFLGIPCQQLSSGTLRRVAVARALASDPDALLLDEPFASLDAVAVAAMSEVLVDAAAEGRLVVVAVHEDAIVEAIATRVLRLDSGRIIANDVVHRQSLTSVGA